MACTLIRTKIICIFLVQESNHIQAQYSAANTENVVPDQCTVNQTPSTSRGHLPSPEKNGASRWRQTNLNRRLKNKRKIKRNLGHSYKSLRGREVEARELGQPCKCRKKCRQLLLGKENDIFNSFWNLGDYNGQNIYLFSLMKAVPKKRTYKKKCKKEVSSSVGILLPYMEFSAEALLTFA